MGAVVDGDNLVLEWVKLNKQLPTWRIDGGLLQKKRIDGGGPWGTGKLEKGGFPVGGCVQKQLKIRTIWTTGNETAMNRGWPWAST